MKGEAKSPAILLVVLKGEAESLKIYATVPYVPTLEHHAYPYRWDELQKDFADHIKGYVHEVQVQFDDLPLRTSRRLEEMTAREAQNPQRYESAPPDFRSALVARAERITEELHLEPIVDFLLSVSDIRLLQVFTNVPNIPWDWLYSRRRKRLLCEAFGIGVTQPEYGSLELVRAAKRDRSVVLKDLQSKSQYGALVVGTASSDGGGAALDQMAEELRGPRVEGLLRQKLGEDVHIKIDLKVGELQRELGHHARELSLVVLCGHFGPRGFRCADESFFKRQNLIDAFDYREGSERGVPFRRHPVVILNGCRSGGDVGNVRPDLQMEADRVLAAEFCKQGAEACLYTGTRVRFNESMIFLKAFLEEILKPGVAIGSALWSARQTVKKAGNNYEWASYHLLGDPGYVMVRNTEEAAEPTPRRRAKAPAIRLSRAARRTAK